MDAVGFVRRHGVVLQSARGPVPNLAEIVAGEPIRGSWWGHPKGHEIFAAINTARDSPAVVATRLVRGKVTLVHRRLWPALARLADWFPPGSLDAIHEEHTETGAHQTTVIAFPEWVPAGVRDEAAALSEDAALAMLPAPVRPARTAIAPQSKKRRTRGHDGRA